MRHFGVLSYKGTGHLNPLIALSRHLIARGHRVTFFQHPALEQRVLQHGLEFFPIEVHGFSGSQQQVKMAGCTTTTSIGEIRERLNRIAGEMEAFLREYPAAIRATRVDALIVGEISLAGPTVAEMLRLPYFIVSTSIPHNFGWEVRGSITSSFAWLDRKSTV